MQFLDSVEQISVKELKNRLDKSEDPFLLDVREAHELEICSLNYGKHIPVAQLQNRLDELKELKDRELIIYCRSGQRSQMAAQFLKAHGFSAVKNLSGGLLAWSREIDRSFPSY